MCVELDFSRSISYAFYFLNALSIKAARGVSIFCPSGFGDVRGRQIENRELLRWTHSQKEIFLLSSSGRAAFFVK
jgi:hypothetical protein